MKIALVSLARRGGMVHFLAELANALEPLCEIVVVRSATADGDYFAPGIRQISLSTGIGRISSLMQSVNPAAWYRLYRALAAADADVIHITGVHPWNPWLVAACKIQGRPIVYTLHDARPHPGAPWMMRIADRLSARWADAVIVLTKDARQQMLKAGFADRALRVIVHPMYTLFRRWRPRNARPTRTVLHIGRLEKYKGLEILLSAWQMARRSIPGWRLVVAGSGSLPPDLQSSRGVTINEGYLSDQEMARRIYEAGIIALPYTSATQSGVVALAQAVGCPVIVSDVGGMREMVAEGRTGLLVPPGDVGALAEALKKLAGDAKRLLRMRRSIASTDGAPWLPAKVAAAHLRAYRELVRRRGR